MKIFKSLTYLLLFLSIIHKPTSANMDFYMSGFLTDETTKSGLCPNTTNKKVLTTMIENNIKEHFVELLVALNENRIKIREFENDEYFLKTFFKLGHVLKDKRTYYIDINIKLYNCAPSNSALDAIINHELQHINDYREMNSVGLIKLGVKMLGKKSRSFYERATDFKSLQHGKSQGLLEYRNWIYARLNEKGLKKKKCYYFTPEEIRRFNQGEQDFNDYFNKYCRYKKS